MPKPLKGSIDKVIDRVIGDGSRTPHVTPLTKRLQDKIDRPTPRHLIIEARAGTGKTTTLIEGLKYVRGLPVRVEPSPQQQAVWDELMFSKDAKTMACVAFNSGIAKELRERVPPGVDARTMHSLGYAAVRSAVRLQPGDRALNADRCADIVCEVLLTDIWVLRRNQAVVLNVTKELVGLCKANLVWGTEEELDELIARHGIEIESGKDERVIRDLVPQVLLRAKDVERDGCVDFNDQVWLPIVLDLPMVQYDLLMGDEVQDWNRCQQALAKKAGRRLCLVGDPKQAIYGFAGADCESMPRMIEELRGTKAGVVVLPLTVTRRCGKAIVVEANKYVRDFQAHESNPEGAVEEAKYVLQPKNPSGNYWTGGATQETVPLPLDKTYVPMVKDGDMVVCRVNAPLLKQCFTFIRMGKRAYVQGKDVSRGLTNLVTKMDARDLDDLRSKLDDWLFAETKKEQARRHPDESKIQAMVDKVECIHVVMEGNPKLTSPHQLVAHIESIFTDDREVRGIRLSSIHKAKGLEANTVFFLRPAVIWSPKPKTDWEGEQEANLVYVAITRAVERLVYVL